MSRRVPDSSFMRTPAPSSLTEDAMTSKTIVRNRTQAFVQQSGRCFYCDALMWTSHPKNFAKTYGLTKLEARQFRCTAEHKLARQDGGPDTAENIAAACLRCNHSRHTVPEALDALRYRDFVAQRICAGDWMTVGAKQAKQESECTSNISSCRGRAQRRKTCRTAESAL